MSTTLATKRAVGYLRVSSTGQTGERHSSLDTQKAALKNTASGLTGFLSQHLWLYCSLLPLL
jgi:hypothetical protein